MTRSLFVRRTRNLAAKYLLKRALFPGRRSINDARPGERPPAITSAYVGAYATRRRRSRPSDEARRSNEKWPRVAIQTRSRLARAARRLARSVRFCAMRSSCETRRRDAHSAARSLFGRRRRSIQSGRRRLRIDASAPNFIQSIFFFFFNFTISFYSLPD